MASGSKRECPRVVVVVASAGRPALIIDLLQDLARQSYKFEACVLAVPDEASLPAGDLPPWAHVVLEDGGAAAQRNAGIAAFPASDIFVFFDDDTVPHPDYIREAVSAFEDDESVIALTGHVLADGAVREAIGREESVRIVEEARLPSRIAIRCRTLYGCNFAMKTQNHNEIFDPRLPLYSWLEDHDLARRLLRHGRLNSISSMLVVHRGWKSGGRVAHKRFGYSQVMNPVYLQRKGSFPIWLAAWEISRPVIKNLCFSFASKQASWRRERLSGNGLAAIDLLRGRVTPEKITRL